MSKNNVKEVCELADMISDTVICFGPLPAYRDDEIVVNSVLLKCRKLRRKDQETSDSIVGFFIEKPQL